MFRIGRKHAAHSYPESPFAGGGPASSGVQCIRYQVGPGPGTYDSVTALPPGAVVLASSFDNDVADNPSNVLFAANTDATIGTNVSPTLFQDATENTPDTAGNYENLLNTLITPGNVGTGKVHTVITGTASGGIAHVTVQYVVNPNP